MHNALNKQWKKYGRGSIKPEALHTSPFSDKMDRSSGANKPNY